jgi:hypothetical protein
MPIGRHICALASLSLTLVSACNLAEVGVSKDTGTGDAADASPPDRDGSVIDASIVGEDADPPGPDAGQVTLTHSDNLDVIGGVSVACFEAVNSYYRVFDLVAEGIERDLHVSKVILGVEECVSGSVGLPATIILSTLDGPFVLANMERIAAKETVVPDVAFPPEGEAGGVLHEVEMDAIIPAGSTLVVELTHRAFGADQLLLVGANRDDLEDVTFLRAPACGESEPTPSSEVDDEEGDPSNMSWVLVVEGES